MADYIYTSDNIGRVEINRQALIGNKYFIDIYASSSMSSVVSSSTPIRLTIVSQADSSVSTSITATSINADEKNAVGLDIPDTYDTGAYRLQLQLPYGDDDYDSTDEEYKRYEWLHYDIQLSKLGEINRTRLERLWSAVNELIETRLSQGLDSKASSYFSTDGVSMSFATLTELTDFRDRLANEISYKKSGGIRNRQVIINADIL